MTLIIMAFFIKKKQYNLALIVLSVLFFASMVFNNNIEFFQTESTQTPQSTQSTQATTEDTSQATTEDASQPTTQAPKATTQAPSQIPELTITSSVDEVNNKVHRINLENYNQLFFVLNSLLESSYVKKNREFIEDVIDNYKINSIFDLSNKVLNKEKNPLYNNFL